MRGLLLVMLATSFAACGIQTESAVQDQLSRLGTEDLASSGAVALKIESEDGVCQASNVKFIRLDNRSEVAVFRPISDKSYVILRAGNYFVHSIGCNFGSGEGGQAVLAMSEFDYTKPIPKGTPIVTVRAGEISDFGVWKMVKSGTKNDGVPYLISATKTAYIQTSVSSQSRRQTLEQASPQIKGRLVSRQPQYAGL